MSGPSLQLNITAPGQQKVEQTVSAVERLAAALRDLPKASAELLKLQKALTGVQAPSGLKGGTGELKELVGEIKNLGAQLNTSFGSLEETIKKGWAGAARAHEAGGNLSANAAERAAKKESDRLKKLDAAFLASSQAQQNTRVLKARSELDLGVSLAGVTRSFGQMAAEAAAALSFQQARDLAFRAADEREIKLAQARDRARVKALAAQDAAAAATLEAAHKEALAINKAMDTVIAAQRTADARYAAMNQRGQARAVLQARSRLDQGIAPDAVAGSFGGAALQAAQQTTLASAMAKVHGEVGRGAPKFKLLSTSMNDAHSAARGLASGFGAMFLTWGNIGPLLAGAALSHSFVQSIKLGVQVRQDLETMRVLSQETEGAIAGLEKQLVSLGENGPFGPRQAAEAMKVLSLAGLGAAQVSSALKPALDLAVVGGTTIEKSASALVAVGTAYGYQAESFGLVGDAMAKAAAISMSSVDGMMESFRSASVVGQQYKVSLNDTATALAVLANVGIRNSAAGTAVRQMYSELSGASSQTRKAMANLGVSVIDSVNGGMRPLLDIIKDIDKALSTKSPEAYQRAIQNMSNERGAKSLVALLEAFSTAAKEAGSTVPTELERIRKSIADAPGFAAISSAQLAATPLKQMEAVASSFQTALLKAFTAVEPTILVISARLKEIFNGADFRDLVSSLAVSVGNMAVFLAEHIGLLKNIVIGYALWKGAAIGLTAANAAVAGATALVHAYKVAMDRAALSAAVAAGGARAAWMAFLGPIGVAIGIGTAAWAVYSATSAQASVSAEDAARVRTDVVLKSLDQEIERLDKVNAEMRKGIGLRAAEAAIKANEDKEKTLTPLRQRAAELEPILARREAQVLVEQERLKSGKTSGTSALDAAIAGRDRVYGQLLATLKESDRVANLIAEKTEAVSSKSAFSAELAARNAANAAKKYGAEGIPTSPVKVQAAQAADLKEVRTLKSQFDAQDRLAQTAFDREMTLLNMKQKAKALSEETYEKYAEEASRRLFESEIKNLQGFVSAAESEMKRLRGTKGGDALAAAIQVDYEEAVSKLTFNLQKVKLAAELKLREPIKSDKDTLRFAKELQDLMIDLQRPLPKIADNRPKWEQELEGWANAQKVLVDARDDFMNGWIQSGRTMWGEFLKTGKLSLKSLGDQVMETIADISYKQFIAKPLSKLGESIFDGGIKMTAGAQSGGSATGDLDNTLQNLRIAAGDLGVSFQNLGSNAWKMLMDFGRGLAAMLSGSGGGGGWVSTLTNLFTRSGGGGGASTEVIPWELGFAKGGAFNHGALAFAAGGVVDRPQYFKFGKGGSNLGLMGEAGPEAILPLARGADGNLGVRAQGGGGGATNVTVASKTTVVIENHGGGPEPEVQTNTQPNGDEMIRVVIKAAAKDMTTGGPLRKAARSSNSLPRY